MSHNTRKITIYPFLTIGLMGGGLLAFLMTYISHEPVGILSFPRPSQPYALMHLLFYFWIGFYGVMFLLSLPSARSFKRLIFVTLIPSFIASLPYYWQSNNTASQFFLIIFSAYALNVFHINYEENRFRINYSSLFHAVWDTAVKLFITLFFVLLCWIILYLCASLFKFIDIKFLSLLIEKNWFEVWASAFFVSIGLYIVTYTDHAVQNGRAVLLLTCKYLFIPLAIISIIFIISLFIMMQQHHFTFKNESLFSSIAFLSLLFINGVYKDGTEEKPYPIGLFWVCRVFMWITPLFSALALYTAYFYNPHTNNVPCLINLSLLFLYTITYAIIAILPQKPWFKGIERANIVLAILLIVVTTISTTPLFIKRFNQTQPVSPIVKPHQRTLAH